MDKRKVESLRDLAIAHFPKAREKRAQAIRFHGDRFADSGLQQAYLFGNPEATAIEKQAIELLKLTFMHPNAQPMEPHNWDPVIDAKYIANNALTLELATENQPYIEAEMLDAARLLCELTGAALPPWVDAAPAPQAGAALPAKRTNYLTPAIQLAQSKCDGTDKFNAPAVFAKLGDMARAKSTPFIGVSDEGLKWLDSNDETHFLTLANLRDRLNRQKTNSAKTR